MIQECKNTCRLLWISEFWISLLPTPTLVYFSIALGPRPQPKVKKTPLPTPLNLLSSGGRPPDRLPFSLPRLSPKSSPVGLKTKDPPAQGLCLQLVDSARFLATRSRQHAPKSNATHARALPQAPLPPLRTDLDHNREKCWRPRNRHEQPPPGSGTSGPARYAISRRPRRRSPRPGHVGLRPRSHAAGRTQTRPSHTGRFNNESARC